MIYEFMYMYMSLIVMLRKNRDIDAPVIIKILQ